MKLRVGEDLPAITCTHDGGVAHWKFIAFQPQKLAGTFLRKGISANEEKIVKRYGAMRIACACVDSESGFFRDGEIVLIIGLPLGIVQV